jgi:hypothetical protein
MDPFLLQWRLYSTIIIYVTRICGPQNIMSMLIGIDTLQKKPTDSSYAYYDCRGATVGDRGSMALMSAYCI